MTSYSTNTLSVFDASDPGNPVPIGYSTSNLSGPSDVFVSGRRAYVTSQLNNRLVVFELSDPSSRDSLGFTSEGLTRPMALYVAGKYAYLRNLNLALTPDPRLPALARQIQHFGRRIPDCLRWSQLQRSGWRLFRSDVSELGRDFDVDAAPGTLWRGYVDVLTRFCYNGIVLKQGNPSLSRKHTVCSRAHQGGRPAFVADIVPSTCLSLCCGGPPTEKYLHVGLSRHICFM